MLTGAFQGYDNAFQDDAFDIGNESIRRKSFAGRELVFTQYVMLQQQKDRIQFKDVYKDVYDE